MQRHIPDSVELQNVDAERAIRQCRIEHAKDPENSALRYYLGRALYAGKEYEAAAEHLSAAAMAGIVSAHMLLGIGKLYGRIPAASEDEAVNHFKQAKKANHILADHFLVTAKLDTQSNANIGESEIDAIRASAEAGFAASWYLLVRADQRADAFKVREDYLLKGDEAGDLRATRSLADLYLFSMLGGYEPNTKNRRFYDREALQKHPARTQAVIDLYEKVIEQSRAQGSINHAAVRLGGLYLFMDGTAFGNRDRATYLVCETISDPSLLRGVRLFPDKLPDCPN